MKRSWKYKIAKITGGNPNLNKKICRLKCSWDEVEKILNGAGKRKRKCR
jgi:hypothetical protein